MRRVAALLVLCAACSDYQSERSCLDQRGRSFDDANARMVNDGWDGASCGAPQSYPLSTIAASGRCSARACEAIYSGWDASQQSVCLLDVDAAGRVCAASFGQTD